MRAEGGAYGEGARVGHPIACALIRISFTNKSRSKERSEKGIDCTLSCQSTPCDAMSDFFDAGIHVQHFGWCRLICLSVGMFNNSKQETFTLEYLQHLKKGVMRTSPIL